MMPRLWGLLLLTLAVLLLSGCAADGIGGIVAENTLFDAALEQFANVDSYRAEAVMHMEAMDMVLDPVYMDMLYEKPDRTYIKMTMSFFGQDFMIETWTDGADFKIKSDMFEPDDMEMMLELYEEQFEAYDPQQYQEMFLEGISSVEKIANAPELDHNYETYRVVADPSKLIKMAQEQQEEQFARLMPQDEALNPEELAEMKKLIGQMFENMSMSMVTRAVINKTEKLIESLEMVVEMSFSLEEMFGEEIEDMPEAMEMKYTIDINYFDYNKPVTFPPYA